MSVGPDQDIHQYVSPVFNLVGTFDIFVVGVCVCVMCVFSFLRQEDEKPEVVALCN